LGRLIEADAAEDIPVTAFVSATINAQENNLNIYQTLKNLSRELQEKLSK